MLNYLALLGGLVFLIKGAGYLVSGSSSIARYCRVPEFTIGLTVVSFGTSLPELVIALVAGAQDSPDLIVGNIVGSNIANILLVLGVASIICPLEARKNTIWRELPFTVLASLILFVMLNDVFLSGSETSSLTRADGLILLSFFGVFIYYVAQSIRSEQDKDWVGPQEGHAFGRSVVEIVVGIVGLGVGGRIAVFGAVNIASAWGMSEAFIGLSVIAIGTSLPELATSAMAAYRRNADIAIGNVVGSNIFNIFLVLGVSGVVQPVAFNPRNNFDLGVMTLATILLFIFMFVGHPRKTIQRKEGAFFVATYVLYLGLITYRG